MSRRTLTRALAAEGTHYLALLDEVRAQIVERQLLARGRSLAELADLLGFATASAFSTWFRKGFGISPREWRKQASGQGRPAGS